jgi:hypothetical protein
MTSHHPSSPAPYQATCVSIDGRGLLIEGPPGSGKSSLALALIDRGAVLVGDDGVLLESRGSVVWALPPPAIAGLLELRGVGLLPYPCAAAPVALVIRLSAQAPRFIELPDQLQLGGIAVPLVTLWPDSPVLHLRAEAALRRYGTAQGASQRAAATAEGDHGH